MSLVYSFMGGLHVLRGSQESDDQAHKPSSLLTVLFRSVTLRRPRLTTHSCVFPGVFHLRVETGFLIEENNAMVRVVVATEAHARFSHSVTCASQTRTNHGMSAATGPAAGPTFL